VSEAGAAGEPGPGHGHAASAAPSAPGAEPPLARLPQPVIVPSWRWRVWVHPASWVRGLVSVMIIVGAVIGVIVVTAVLLALLDDLRSGSPAVFWTLSLLVGAGALVAIVAVARYLSWRLGRQMATVFAESIPRTEPARSYMVAELAEAGPPRERWTSWRARRWVEQVRQGSDARAFVSMTLSERVLRYDRTDRPVEPERIGGPLGSVAVGQLAIGAALTAGFAVTTSPVSLPTIVAAAATLVSLVRVLRRRALFSPVVAGQGWVQHGSSRWTAEDSVLVATGLVNAKVAIVGPQGVLQLRLRSARQADLEQLWIRWMHPLPNLAQQAFEA